jgi:hypothetical protein
MSAENGTYVAIYTASHPTSYYFLSSSETQISHWYIRYEFSDFRALSLR